MCRDSIAECWEDVMLLMVKWLSRLCGSLCGILGCFVAWMTNGKTICYANVDYVFQYGQRWFGGVMGCNGLPSGRLEIVELFPSPVIKGRIVEIIYNSNQFTVLTDEGNMYACSFARSKKLGRDFGSVIMRVVDSISLSIGSPVDYIDCSRGHMAIFTDVTGSKWLYDSGASIRGLSGGWSVPLIGLDSGVLCKLDFPQEICPCSIIDVDEYFVGVTHNGRFFRIHSDRVFLTRGAVPMDNTTQQPNNYECSLFGNITDFDRKAVKFLREHPRGAIAWENDSRLSFFEANCVLDDVSLYEFHVSIPPSIGGVKGVLRCYAVTDGMYLLDRLGRWFYMKPWKKWQNIRGRDLVEIENSLEFEEVEEYYGMEFLGGSGSSRFDFALIDKANGRILIEHEAYSIAAGNLIEGPRQVRHRREYYLSIIASPLVDYATDSGCNIKNARINQVFDC